MIILMFCISLFANTSYSYLIGDYNNCVNTKTKTDTDEYIRALCYVAIDKYDDARYVLSKLSTKIPKNDNLLFLVLNSLVEIAYLSGEYEKAKNLSKNSISYCLNDLTYACLISKQLCIKADYELSPISALRKMKDLELTSDSFFYFSLKTN